MKKVLTVVLGGVLLVALTGCNAMKGAGKDVENTGQNIQDTVDRND